jgi:hypothetical protein
MSRASGWTASTRRQADSTPVQSTGSPGRGQGRSTGKTDEAHAGPCGQSQLGVEGVGRAAQEDEGLAGPVEGGGQCARRVGAHPAGDAVAPAGDQLQARLVVDMEVRPASVGRHAERDLQPGRIIGAAARGAGDLTHRVGGIARPPGPVARDVGVAAREVAAGQQVVGGGQVDHLDVVEHDAAGRAAEAEMQRAVGGVRRRRELERDVLGRGGDRQVGRAGSAPEHAGPRGLAIDQQAWRPAGGIHAYGQCGDAGGEGEQQRAGGGTAGADGGRAHGGVRATMRRPARARQGRRRKMPSV